MKSTRILKNISNTLFASAVALSVSLCPKQCKTPIQPMKDRIVQKVSDSIQYKKVLVLDCFYKNNINIDNNLIGDISHGRIVSGIIEKGLPNADVYKRNVKYIDLENGDSMRINVVEPLIKEIKNGKKYDAVNLSMGAEMTFSDLSKDLGFEVNSDNIADKSKQVKKAIRENIHKFGGTGKSAMELVDCLDSLSAMGTKVYVGAGNGGAEKFNFLALIDNAVNVGSVNKKGIIKSHSENHSLINRWSRDYLPVEKTKTGYSIGTGFGDIFVDKKECSGMFHIRKQKGINGTSFASPKALVEDLK